MSYVVKLKRSDHTMRVKHIERNVTLRHVGRQGPAGAGIIPGGTTGQTLAKASNADYDMVWSSAGAGDMIAAIYDPQGIDDDVFDRANHTGTQPISSIVDLQAELDGKAILGHNHDDRYYTETETNTLLAGKSDTGHTHPADTTKQGKIYITVGAQGDPGYVTDGTGDQAQIQAAIDAVNVAGGGTVFIQAGSYDVDPISGQTYSIKPRSNVHLKGAGINKTKLVADASADIRRVFFNDGLEVGQEFVENFILSDMTVDMNERQSMGLEVRKFRNWKQYNVEWKDILCIGVGGASRWATKFGTIVPGDVEGTKSEGLYIWDNWYHDNFCRTFEVILCTNVRGGAIHHNKFENNTSLAPNYDEVSLFIYNDDIDYHDNYSYNSKYHGVGTKESFRTKIHDNVIVKDELWNSSYIGVRAWNTKDCAVTNNTFIFPDPIDLVGDITDIDDPVTLYPGEWNETIISTTTTIELTDGNTTDDMYRGQPIYSTALPEGCTVLSIDDSTTFRVNKTAPGGLDTDVDFILSHIFIGMTHADRNIGYDGHTLRNEYTRNLTVKGNKFRNVYYGVQSGSASLGTDTDADADILGTSITLTEARYTIEGVEYTVTTPGEMTEYIQVGYKITGTGIPANTRITAIDTTTGILTVDNTVTTGTDIRVTIDSNTIAYRSENVNISDNQFDGVLRNAIRWGVDNVDTDVTRFYVRNNVVGPWYGSGGDAIQLLGYSTDPSLFNEVYIENNVIGPNLEGTSNGGISILGLTAARIKGNIIPEFGTRGRIKLYSNAVVNDLQDNWMTKTASYTLLHGDENIMVDATSGSVTIAPPEPIYHFGKEYLITKGDASANTVVVNPTSTYNINGTTSYTLTDQYQSIRIKSDGTQWLIIGTTGSSTPTLQQVFDAGQPITVANNDNQTLLYTNNDTTNNPDSVTITNAGTAHGFRVNQNGVSASNKHAIFVDSNAVQVNAPLVRIRQQNASSTQPALQLDQAGSGAAISIVTGNLSLTGGVNVVLSATTGTKIGTGTTQKLGFYNATPVAQPTGNALTALSTLGLIATPTLAESDITNLVTDLAAKQPLDSDLTTIAGLTATTDNFIVSVSSAWASRTPAQVRTTLGLVVGTNVQAWDADLDTWATKTAPSGTVLGTTDSQTLTNKDISATNNTYRAASDTVTGAVELATIAETTTGTDATRAVTPDGLAGSTVFGRKAVCIQVTDGTASAATGDGKAYFTIPESLNGMNLVRAQATVVTAGTTNASTVMIHNKTDAADMLSGAISIASGGTVGTVGTINAATDDVVTNDVIRIDVDSVSTTPPQGLMVTLEFQLP